MALRRARRAERAAHGKILALVVQGVKFARIKISPRRLVARERVAIETAPQPADDIDELLSALVAVAMRGMSGKAEVGGVLGIPAGHQVPAGAAAGDVIQRR